MNDLAAHPRTAYRQAEPVETIRELSDLRTWFNGDGKMRYDGTAESARHDNTRRAGFAGRAVTQFAIRTGHWVPKGAKNSKYAGANDSSEFEPVLCEMLAAVRHLCDVTGLDFDEISERGHNEYLSDLDGE